MRNLLLIALVTTATTSNAQITLEHSYAKVNNLSVIKVEDDGYKYACMDTVSKDIQVFNLDHTLWKTIPTKIPAGSASYAYGNMYISKKLFNSNSNLEAVITYYGGTGSTFTYTTKIMDETGAEIQKFADVTAATVASVGNAWKLICTKGYYNYDVYSLPGSYSGLKVVNPTGNNGSSTELFPNPMNTAATLRYTLPTGAHSGTVQVYNSNGQLMRSYAVTDAFNDVLIQRDNMPTGTYFYKLKADNYESTAEAFSIQ